MAHEILPLSGKAIATPAKSKRGKEKGPEISFRPFRFI
jgi:hypothetical protein